MLSRPCQVHETCMILTFVKGATHWRNCIECVLLASLVFPPIKPIFISPLGIGLLIALVRFLSLFLEAWFPNSLCPNCGAQDTATKSKVQTAQQLQQTWPIRWHLRVSAGSVGFHGCKWTCPGCARVKTDYEHGEHIREELHVLYPWLYVFNCFATLRWYGAFNPLWKLFCMDLPRNAIWTVQWVLFRMLHAYAFVNVCFPRAVRLFTNKFSGVHVLQYTTYICECFWASW